jgi:hypothetical protein
MIFNDKDKEKSTPYSDGVNKQKWKKLKIEGW